jgi:hypothetical protein
MSVVAVNALVLEILKSTFGRLKLTLANSAFKILANTAGKHCFPLFGSEHVASSLHGTPSPQIYHSDAITTSNKHETGVAVHPLSLNAAATIVLPAVAARNVCAAS